MNRFLLVLTLASLSTFPALASPDKCTASIGGREIHTVYIVGDDPWAVSWAYKNISDHGCLTPVTDATKADVILNLQMPPDGRPATPAHSGAFSVACTDDATGSSCRDSDGNVLMTSCQGGDCTSYYGPNPLEVGLHSIGEAIYNAVLHSWSSASASLYLPSGQLLWSQRKSAMHPWDEQLRDFTNQPICKRGMGQNRGYRDNCNHRHVGMPMRVSIDIHPKPLTPPTPPPPSTPEAVTKAVAAANSRR